eukprot:7694760-Pyramimonas_sp.AAC.1
MFLLWKDRPVLPLGPEGHDAVLVGPPQGAAESSSEAPARPQWRFARLHHFPERFLKAEAPGLGACEHRIQGQAGQMSSRAWC